MLKLSSVLLGGVALFLAAIPDKQQWQAPAGFYNAGVRVAGVNTAGDVNSLDGPALVVDLDDGGFAAQRIKVGTVTPRGADGGTSLALPGRAFTASPNCVCTWGGSSANSLVFEPLQCFANGNALSVVVPVLPDGGPGFTGSWLVNYHCSGPK